MCVYKMAEIEKEEVESSIYHLVAMGVNIMWQHLIFNFIIYIVQLYIEGLYNLADMLGCWVMALPSTKQIMNVYKIAKTEK